MNFESYETQLQALCFGPEPAADDLERLGQNPSKWGLYRRMVQGRIIDMLDSALPRSCAAMSKEDLSHIAQLWFQAAPPRNPAIRDLPPHFVEWFSTSTHTHARLWLVDLMRFEIALWAASYDGLTISRGDLFAFDRAPKLNPTRNILTLSHRSFDTDLDHAKKLSRTRVAVFRHPETHLSMWRELDEMGFAFLTIASERREQLRTLMTDTARLLNTPCDEAFVAHLASSIGTWLDDGLLIGSIPQNGEN